MFRHKGNCHCGAISIELRSDRPPESQILGACQCSFCRKHNVRAFSDPKAEVTITANEPAQIQRYRFGLMTAEQIICRRCGIYVAMIIADGDEVRSTINIDTLNDRAAFTGPLEARDFSTEDRAIRIARRKTRWTPTILSNWPYDATNSTQ